MKMQYQKKLKESAENIVLPVIDCSKGMAIFLILLNLFPFSPGTFLASVVDSKRCFNSHVFFVWCLQFTLYAIAYLCGGGS